MPDAAERLKRQLQEALAGAEGTVVTLRPPPPAASFQNRPASSIQVMVEFGTAELVF